MFCSWGSPPAAMRFSPFILSEDRTASQYRPAPGYNLTRAIPAEQRKQIASIVVLQHARRRLGVSPTCGNIFEIFWRTNSNFPERHAYWELNELPAHEHSNAGQQGEYEYGRHTPRGDNFNEGVMERSWFLHDCDPDACCVPRRERCDLHHREFGFAEAFAGAGIGANRVHLQSVSRRRCPRNLVGGCPGLP